MDLTNIFMLIASIIVIVKSADLIIKATSNLAKEFGITEYFLGFVIVAFGTSLPELGAAIFGSIKGESELIIGNLIGASIIDATIVLGIMAIVGKKIMIEGKMFKTFDKTLFMTLGMVIIPVILGFDGTFSRIDGGILLLAFSFYLFMLIEREETFRHHKKILIKDLIKDTVMLLISFPLLFLSAKFLVESSVEFADYLGIPTFIIGLSVLAVGTTTPELTIGIRSVLKGLKNIGFGEIIGSIIANICFILGLACLINPIFIEKEVFIPSALFLVTSTFVALLFLQKEVVTWKEGLALVFIYLTFLISVIIL